MKRLLFCYWSIFLASLLLSLPAMAQDGSSLPTEEEEEGPIVRFNGLGRVLLDQTELQGNITEEDTTTARKLTDGEFLLDLVVNATPNDKNEIQGIIRLRNEFGGFFGAGATVEIRELWARGIIADVLEYRVGDMDVVMTPYTLFSFQEDGIVNEPALFGLRREVIEYEQFYTDRFTRRLQGAKLDFGLQFTEVLDEMDFSGFIARVRGTDFFTVPTRFTRGASAKWSTQSLHDSLGWRAEMGLNLAHTYDDLQSGEATSGIRNTVITGDFKLHLLETQQLSLQMKGELGQSRLEFKRDSISVFNEESTFLDVGLEAHLKPQELRLSARFRDVGPDFFSIGAQSKRINYNAEKSYFNRLGNERNVRPANLFDNTRDRALYSFQLFDMLGAYDPMYNNTYPFGVATPNRRGLEARLQYGERSAPLFVSLQGSFLSEIRGQGTPELKDFTLLRAQANFRLDRYLSLKNKLALTAGYRFEQTQRGGLEIEQVDLTSHLLEAGLEAELFSNFELLLGVKALRAEGNEYIPQITNFNDVQDFPGPYIVDGTETLLGAGFKYQFKKDIFLTLQYHAYQNELAAEESDYFDLNQVFVLYNMKF